MAMDNNTFVGNVLDRGPWLLYDTQQVTQAAAIPTPWQFFTIPIGGTIVGGPLNGTQKTKVQTNLVKSGQLKQPERFLMRSLGFEFTASTWLPDFITVLENSYFEFKIGDKIYHEGTLDFFPPGIGIGGSTTVNNQQVWTLSQPTLTARRDFGDYARVISDALQFSLQIIFPTAQNATSTASGGNNITLKVILDGILDRLVQ